MKYHIFTLTSVLLLRGVINEDGSSILEHSCVRVQIGGTFYQQLTLLPIP